MPEMYSALPRKRHRWPIRTLGRFHKPALQPFRPAPRSCAAGGCCPATADAVQRRQRACSADAAATLDLRVVVTKRHEKARCGAMVARIRQRTRLRHQRSVPPGGLGQARKHRFQRLPHRHAVATATSGRRRSRKSSIRSGLDNDKSWRPAAPAPRAADAGMVWSSDTAARR